MNKQPKKNNFDIISILSLALAAIFIMISLIAPILFTDTDNYLGWDFTNTGAVGDTIGGIMSPFIGIAGVLLTFLAFYMQVKANNLQRTQFIKSLSKGTLDEKIDSYYKLDLLKLDLENTQLDIKARLEQVKTWKKVLEENLFYGLPLQRKTLKHYDRVSRIERMSIYKGFKNFVSQVDNSWIDKFNNLYNIVDFIPEAIKEIYKVTDYHNTDIYKKKLSIRNSLRGFEKQCVTYINNNVESPMKEHLQIFLVAYQSELRKSISNSTETDLISIKQELENLATNTKLYLEENADKEAIHIHNNHIAKILYDMNFVIAQSNHLVSELNTIIQNFEGQDAILTRLDNLNSILINSLSTTTPEQLEQELLV